MADDTVTMLRQPRDWLYLAYAADVIPWLGVLTGLLLPVTALIVARVAQREWVSRWGGGALMAVALLVALVLALAGGIPVAAVGAGELLALGILLGLAEANARPRAARVNWAPIWRRINPAHWKPIAVLLLLELLFALLLLRAPGTGDVSSFFIGWIDTLLTRGLAQGYRLIDSNHLPLVAVILPARGRVGRALSLDAFLSFKLLLVLALLTSTLCFWRWTRDILLTAPLAVSLLLHSVALGYLDTLFAPTFILSLRA